MNSNKELYSSRFYQDFEYTSSNAAKAIVPELLSALNPKSVVDFGGGEGIWGKTILDADDKILVTVVDGEWIDEKRVLVPAKCFLRADISEPIMLERKYDLAISLEVAEHIGHLNADIYIDNLVRAADAIFFSAAIPYQGGTGHVNEQWLSYWVEKFVIRGYYPDFSIRRKYWNDDRISPWRRQNMCLFSREKGEHFIASELIDIVHPEMYLSKEDRNCEKILYIGIDEIEQMLNMGQDIIFYGAGKVTTGLINRIMKLKFDYSRCHIVVTRKQDVQQIMNIDVEVISEANYDYSKMNIVICVLGELRNEMIPIARKYCNKAFALTDQACRELLNLKY